MSGDCKELTQIPVVQQAIQDPEDKQQLNEIFNCIYKLFRKNFIEWIIKINPGFDLYELIAMAEDAFQDGLIVFYRKAKDVGLKPDAVLGTIIFAFAKWQFLALRKKALRSNIVPFSDEMTFGELINNEETYYDDFLKILLTEKEYQLHQAIRTLKKEWQIILYWFYFDQLKPESMAKKLKVGEGHVNNTLTKARKELKKILISKFNF